MISVSLVFCPYCGKNQTKSFSEKDLKKNPYEILQISEDAEIEVINAAYKSLSKKYHPDIDPSPDSQDKMKDINWAYELLSNPETRKEWDKKHKASEHAQTPKPPRKTTKREESQVANKKTQSKKGEKHPPKQKERIFTPGRIAALVISFAVIAFFIIYISFNNKNALSDTLTTTPLGGSTEIISEQLTSNINTPSPSSEESENLLESTCTVVSRAPTPGPTEQSLVPPLSDEDWVHGPDDAAVTIIEYGDFQ
jgi:curved DNA-binding protein CbpA